MNHRRIDITCEIEGPREIYINGSIFPTTISNERGFNFTAKYYDNGSFTSERHFFCRVNEVFANSHPNDFIARVKHDIRSTMRHSFGIRSKPAEFSWYEDAEGNFTKSEINIEIHPDRLTQEFLNWLSDLTQTKIEFKDL